MVVDSKHVLLGSHDWSEHGVFANRDASLIVYDEEVARYYERIFEFDWDRASRRAHEVPPGIMIHRPGDRVPAGYEVVDLHEALL